MNNRKLRILMVSDDPHTILSYGLLSRMILDKLYKEFEFHYLSFQRQMGEPIPIKDNNGYVKYIKYASHLKGERNPTNLPNVIQQVKPDIIWTNFDVQHYLNIVNQNYIPNDLCWVGWIPWDNHDTNQIGRARKAFKDVDVRIAISRFGLQFLVKNGLRMDGYIYNIVDTDSFTPISEDQEYKNFKKKLKIQEDKKYLLFVGRPNWRKRMTHMMAIISKLKERGRNDIKLLLHSNIQDPASNTNLPEIIDAFGLKDMIIPTQGFWDKGIPKRKLNYLYNAADLYIAGHGGEGFCLPIGEAMAVGTSFVASDICTTREFVGENFERGFPAPVYYRRNNKGQYIPDRGVVRPYPKVNEFADIIETALEDEKRLQEMGENGIKWTRGNCSPQRIAKEWRKLFNKLDIKTARIESYD